ncbi:glycosyltransferase [Flavobacterium galactosidilyticum]|uniref:glycosyltransferase family 2 protein n=1 Tax=Flavobacterium galactosidilyticum TaxID=2893886 RepID=UPI001E43D669|nr:glycosyltransferase [Flavobacterium sp. F-340]UFH46683.1 glycosyltransferase [Flavobacterium sp. F-340]
MKAAFICVNYNNSKITQEFIRNILDLKKENDVKIIVVDNASEESDIKGLYKFIQDLNNIDVVLLKSSTNLGYFKGLNVGINYINSSEYDYVIVGNNDLTFDDTFFMNLGSKEINNDVFVIAPNIIRLDGVHQNPHIVKKFSQIQNIYRKLYFSNYYIGMLIQFFYNNVKSILIKEDRVNNDKEQIVLMGYGACYILTKHFFNIFKELSAPVFLMGEEGILANQVLGANGVTLYCPDLLVNHHDHTSIGKVPSKKLYSFSQDSFRYYLKNLKHIQ